MQAMVQLVIQRYTREAGVRSLERNLAALARAAAVRVAEQEQVVPLSKGVEGLSTPLLENRLVDSTEVEMEVIPMGVNNRDISNTFRITSPLVVDEAMVEKVLGVISVQLSACFLLEITPALRSVPSRLTAAFGLPLLQPPTPSLCWVGCEGLDLVLHFLEIWPMY
jgi:hypothetical protein